MKAQLDLSLDRESEIPLGTQLAWKLRALILAGVLSPGARVPGVREVAEAAAVNVNTVRSVFARLEEQGLLVSEQGRGTFVAASAQPDRALAEAARAAIARAREAGIDPRELAAALYVTREIPGARAAANDELAQKRALRGQIAQLERELARLEPLGTLKEPAEAPAGRLLTVGELREVRDQLQGRIELLRREREEVRAAAAAEAAEELEEERATRSPRAPQWRNSGVWTGHPAVGVSWTAS